MKKVQSLIKSNKFEIIKINLEAWKFNEIYLKYISTKIFNRIISFFLDDSDFSFLIKIFSKKSNNFCNKLELSKIKAQGDTMINKYPENYISY